MTRPLFVVAAILIALVFLPAVVAALVHPGDTTVYELGVGDRVPTFAPGFEPVDNVPTVDPADQTTTTAARSKHRSDTFRPASAIYATGVLQDMIRAGFARFGAAVADEAVHVAGCESTGDETGQNLDPAAVNGLHAGLFQLSREFHEERAARLGYRWEQMFEPGPNIAVAADLYAEQQWGPWTCRWAAAA